ncbi:DUF333 domain-containing protein [Ruegeria sp.]|uniref:putative hemolysin n=1 Tax=Ruegeria sp. TaxID=1879320 RepID=UPI003B595E3E
MSRILLTAVGLTALAACDEAATPDSTTQLANPAATYCIDSGAKYEIRDGDNGQSGVCILTDGREVDAWEYFRENNPA